jgi:hypothetical protein
MLKFAADNRDTDPVVMQWNWLQNQHNAEKSHSGILPRWMLKQKDKKKSIQYKLRVNKKRMFLIHHHLPLISENRRQQRINRTLQMQSKTGQRKKLRMSGKLLNI